MADFSLDSCNLSGWARRLEYLQVWKTENSPKTKIPVKARDSKCNSGAEELPNMLKTCSQTSTTNHSPSFQNAFTG